MQRQNTNLKNGIIEKELKRQIHNDNWRLQHPLLIINTIENHAWNIF
jgi:hypothetical protein